MDHETACELLLACLLISIDQARDSRLERLSAPEWEIVIGQSDRHGVTPLLYRRLNIFNQSMGIPAGIVQTLRRAYLRNSARNMRLYNEVSKMLKYLRRESIPVILLKGAHLSAVVSENTALPPMNDVDLLVRKADLPRVVTKFCEMGYKPSQQFRLEMLIEECKHLPFFTKAGTIPVELHWTIDNPGSPIKTDVDGLWTRAYPATISGVEVLVMSPEDLLLHMCLHISFLHRFNVSLKSLCNVCETLRHYREEINWEQVQLRASQWGIQKCVYLTLYLARQLLAAIVPDDVMDVLEPDDFNLQMVAMAKHQLFDNHDRLPLLSDNLAGMWGAKRLQDKAVSFLKSFFPSPRTMANMYPAASRPLFIYAYYPVRFKDLFIRYGRTTWWLLRGEKRLVAAAERNYTLTNWLTSA